MIEIGNEQGVKHPLIIQGGMAVGIARWFLSKEVALAGVKMGIPTLGVVTGIGAEIIMARELQDGDNGGHYRRALEAFPYPEISAKILDRYFYNPKRGNLRYINTPKIEDYFSEHTELRRFAHQLTIAANFAEVWLAKEGHDGLIGINHLEKVQPLHPSRLLGAMLAGVNYLLEGAGMVNQVPAILDLYTKGEEVFRKGELARYKVKKVKSQYAKEPFEDIFEVAFNPLDYLPSLEPLKRPYFLAIISREELARYLANKVPGVDGFVIEGPTAGGHNYVNKRNRIDETTGSVIFGPKDYANVEEIISYGKPCWVAGGYSTPEKFVEARELGVIGTQSGSIEALSIDSGMKDEYRKYLLKNIMLGTLEVITSPTISPTGYAFKMALHPETVSNPQVYEARTKRCSIGHLQVPCDGEDKNGKKVTRWVCTAEPEETYRRKMGQLSPEEEEKLKRAGCLCNALTTTAGKVQIDSKGEEPGIITIGTDLGFVLDKRLKKGEDGISYTAREAIRYQLSNFYTPLPEDLLPSD